MKSNFSSKVKFFVIISSLFIFEMQSNKLLLLLLKKKLCDHCIQCGQCEPHCPQGIKIPRELMMIDKMIEELKKVKG